MPSYKRPGVYAEEVLNLSSAISPAGGSIAAFVGANLRGPTTPVYIQSWSEYLARFGGFQGATNYLPHAIHQFFSNGGREAYVCRVAGPAPTLPATAASTRTLKDTLTVIDTLKIDATNPGAWGQQIYVETSMSGTDRFNLTVRYGGSTDAYTVERWTDLSMDNNDARYAPALINSPTSGSLYIVVTDMNSTTPAPGDRPAVTPANTPLTSGVDTAATGTQLQAALPLFDVVDGPLTFNMPGVTSATGTDNMDVQTALLSYCATRGDAFAVLDPEPGIDVAGVVADAGTLPSSFGALYYPWIFVADPSSSVQGAVKKIPPGGAVVGQYARTDVLRGVWKAPAGIDNRLAGALAIETKLTNANLDTLNTSLVNAIRQIPGVGIAIMGARTLRSTQADRYVSVRRLLNYIRQTLIEGTRWALFEPNDGALWGALSTGIQQFLLALWQQGGLRGGSAAQAFYVKCDSDNNTLQSIAQGQVNIEVGVAVQYPAEFVVIRIGQWTGGSTATVTV